MKERTGFPSPAVLATICLATACAGGGDPAASPARPAAAPTSAGGVSASTDTPSPSPTTPGLRPCAIGYGTIDTRCERTKPNHLVEVETAIDQLVQQRPELFDTTVEAGTGGYFVKDADAYLEGVMKNLEAMGLCADFDRTELQVKRTNDLNDQFDVLTSTGHVRRGAGSYRNTCAPAAFPLDPDKIIEKVRVAFFSIRCPEGVTAPGNGLGRLPLGCAASVTATPKDKNGDDVNANLHGPQIEWLLQQEERIVDVDEFPGVAFNKNVTPRALGHFNLCAVVKGVQGCLFGEVIE
jgi:hypothetical protein